MVIKSMTLVLVEILSMTTNTLKFLGLWLDPNLNGHTHVDYIS